MTDPLIDLLSAILSKEGFLGLLIVLMIAERAIKEKRHDEQRRSEERTTLSVRKAEVEERMNYRLALQSNTQAIDAVGKALAGLSSKVDARETNQTRGRS